jgi:hypothetical protein
MSNRRVPPKGGSPEKRAARRAARKANAASGRPAGTTAQMSHASGPAGRRKAREGERAMEQQRVTRPLVAAQGPLCGWGWGIPAGTRPHACCPHDSCWAILAGRMA